MSSTELGVGMVCSGAAIFGRKREYDSVVWFVLGLVIVWWGCEAVSRPPSHVAMELDCGAVNK